LLQLGAHRRNEGMAVCYTTTTSLRRGDVARSCLAKIVTCTLTCLLVVNPAFAAQQPAPVARPAQSTYDFDIKEVPLSDAIRFFSMKTGLQILHMPENAKEERQIVGPLKGSFTPQEALTRLLKPTGLRFYWVNDRTVGIEPPPPTPPPPKQVQKRAAKPPAPKPEAAVQPYRVPGLIDSLDVEGKRELEGSIGDGTGSLLTVDRDAIERMGASTVSDVIKNISPQTYNRPEGFRQSGAQYAELRGLRSSDYTLVLINGRRAPPSAANVTTNAFDLNTIPLPAVERIEVLLESGSVPYGADTIGGVINIIMRKEIKEPIAGIHFGSAADGAHQQRASFGVGHSGDAISVSLFADYFDIGDLIGSERERWRDQDFTRYGGPDMRQTLSSPGNVTSTTALPLPGLSSRFAAVPIGSSGNTIEDFVPTAGTFNRDSFFQDLAVVPDARRVSVMGRLDAKLAEKLVLSANVLHVDRSANFQQPPPIVAGVAPATNPYNPFGTAVAVQSVLSALGPQVVNVEAQLLRAVTSLHGEVSSWRWELSFLDTSEDAEAWTSNVLDPVSVARALAHPDPAQALDVFNDGPGGSPQLLRTLIAPPRIERFGSNGRQVLGMLVGPLFELPAGKVTAVTGGEWREEKVAFDATAGAFDRDVSATFAELRVPLVASRMDVPLVEELEVTLGARWDDYSDSGDVLNPQFGLSWKPHSDLTLRAAHARTFRPPSLFELFTPRISVPAAVVDPRRPSLPSLPSPITLISGGNPDLVPVEGDLFSAGFTFAPSWARGLKLSANAWRIEMDERITFFASSTLLENEAAFPERVIRAAPTPEDIAAGRPGRLLALDTSRLNLGRIEARGVDFNASYEFATRFGRFAPGLMGTWIDEFKTMELPGMPLEDRVNVASPDGTIVRWRAAATLGWGRGRFGAFVAARYVPSYEDTSLGVRNGDVVSSQTTFDVQGSIELGGLITQHAFWEGTRLTLGAVNVTDEMPPFSQVNSLAGFDFSQGDLKGRFVYLRLGKIF
jgi:iron complex outermembrane receptor protein